MLPQQASGAEDRPVAGTADPGPRAASDETHSSGPELSCRSTDFGLGRGSDRGRIDPLVGRDLGEFRIERLLAQGGMGRVYVARQRSPDRLVAVKFMRSSAILGRAGQRFRREAELLGRLRHPAIAQVYTAGSCNLAGDETPYFVMEYVAGGEPLVKACAGTGRDVRQRLALFAEVCEAVGHGHAAGIVHRDLKPANILVDAEGRAKVIDFGVARLIEDGEGGFTETGVFVGTRQYMSPEQYDGGSIGPASDVYSLGVILHELLAGRLPHDLAGLSLTETARIVRERPPRRLQVDDRLLGARLEAVAATCLAKQPADRYPTAGDVAADIRRVLAGLPVTARRPGILAASRAWCRSHPRLVAGGLATALAAAVMSFVTIRGERWPGEPGVVAAPGPTASIPGIASTRSTPLQWVSVDFSEPMQSLSTADLRLSRDGAPLPTDGLTVVGSRVRWEVRGLDRLTAEEGRYELAVVGTATSPIDLAGRRLAAPVRVTWQMPPRRVVSFNLLDDEWRRHVVSMTGVERYTERNAGSATFIRPTVPGREGSIVMRFSAPFEIRAARLAAGLAVWTTGDPFPYDPGARAAIDVSPDGETWTNLVSLEANRGGFGGGPFEIGDAVAGSREVWVRARLTATREWPGDGPIYSQFLRCDPDHPEHRFELSMSGPSPVPPPPDGSPPADG
jgi:predicted Ser/Thr protein kinase